MNTLAENNTLPELSTPIQVKKFFFNDKPVAALLAVKRISNPMGSDECYGRKISIKIDSTYAHTVKTLAKMQKLGLINTEKKGRKKVHTLTDTGQEYADIFERLLHKIEDDFGDGASMDTVPMDTDSASSLAQAQY